MALRWTKNLAKRLIRYSVGRLPDSVKTVARRELWASHKMTFDDFCAVATNLNVVGLWTRGEYGVISNSIADRFLLPIYARTGRWAHDTNELFITLFAAAGGTYIDVGANIGLTTIPVAQNPNVDCFALEPDPSNFHYLSLNVAANCPHRNVRLYQLAAFSERKKLRFELSPDNLGDHRIRLTDADGKQNEQERRTIEVDAVALDDLITPKRKPIAVKIDTQGAEPFVIAGGAKLLANASLLIMEIWPYGITRLGGSIEAIVSLLRDNFETVHLPVDGSGELPGRREPMSSQVASARLIQMMGQKGDPSFYLDVVASNTVRDAIPQA